jgi:hypothetical protein
MPVGDALREQIKHVEFAMSETNYDPKAAFHSIVDALKEVARTLDGLEAAQKSR